ncbi:MAG: fimbrillin family protein [Bacteroidales bacterium]|nr:fimbrillin family protein [Bacteroidales bacterium]
MKKFFAFFAVAAMFVACAKESAEVPVDVTETPVENGTEMPVLLKSNVTASVQTKAQGGVDQWNTKQNLYIYGFQRVSTGADYANPLIDNVLAQSPATDGSTVLNVLNSDAKPYYYEGNSIYDFYGYYVDDLYLPDNIDNYVDVRSDGIYLPIELTGGEDVMVAKADNAKDVANAKDEGQFTGDENWNDAYAYSAYAARRGVHPTLTFKHQLVRFTFEIISGSEFDAEDETKSLSITGLEMNARNIADLCVAGSQVGLTNIDNEKSALKLCSRGADGKLTTLTEYKVPSKEVVIENNSNVIGESLMVIPNEAPAKGAIDSFGMTLYMTQAGAPVKYPVDIKFTSVTGAPSGQTQFTAGYSYRIKIKVYSLEEIELSAELEEWLSGGEISIDTDDAPTIL